MTDAIRAALHDVRSGRHASAVLDDLFRTERPDATRAASLRAELHAAIRATGMPAWLRARIDAAWGTRADALVASLMHDAPTYIRVNTLKTTTDNVMQALAAFRPHRCDFPNAIRIDAPFGLFRSEAFRNGWFEQQDVASQRVTLDLDVHPGMRIVDACAGTGGKTLHMAALMANRGRVIAIDIVERKLDELRRRAQRAGVTIVDTRLAATTKTVKRLAASADRVLVDAPCSGTGVLRRNPDIMMHLTEAMLNELLQLQTQILRRSALAARKGGRVVYATCSILSEEGEQQVQRFLAEHPSFRLVAEARSMPDVADEDGFYRATLERTDDA